MIFCIVGTILILDQLTKFLISVNFAPNQPVPLINGIIYLTLVHNRGAAFGILRNQTPLFVITTVIAVILIALSLKDKKNKQPLFLKIALGLILAGGLGNLIDRIVFGYVIDFIDLRFWPVFNIADSAITIGALLLAWSICFPKFAK